MGHPLQMGFAWYKPDQWSLLLQVSSDRDDLESTYEEWLSNAEATLNQIKSKGIQIEKIMVDVSELVQWCKDHKVPINGKSRSSYTTEVLRRGHEKTRGT